MQPKTRNPLRCGCNQTIAYYGVNTAGEPYLHVMSRRQTKILSNVVMFGDCEIMCTKCQRWHIFSFPEHGAELEREQSLEPPAEIVDTDVVERANTA